jgi:hypothetical protein
MSKHPKPVVSRRSVFAGAGAVGAMAAVAAAVPLVRPEGRSRAEPAPSADDDGRYQATHHVLRYYQTARV